MAKLAKEIEVIVEEPEIEVVIEEPKAEAAPAELEIPEGGIGGFAMADEDFEVLEAEEAKKEFGEDGLAQFTEQAKKMAGYGRFGDDSVAHIQTGEIVVPLALIENNPALKEQIFESLRENGIEDPEQYVVGSTANSINPETGLMEFGFLKKIFRGIKKFFKSVVKVVKKIAPIVLPIALSMFGPLGAIYGAAVGSGIGTLIAGGNIKDALKAGLISGATGGLMKGIGGAMSGQGFLKSITAELAAPGARFAQLGQGISNTAKNIIPGGEVGAAGGPTITSAFDPTPAVTAITPETVPQEYVSGLDVSGNPISTGAQEYVSGMDVSGNPISTGAETPRTFSETVGDRMFRGGESKADIAARAAEEGKAAGIRAAELGYSKTGIDAAIAAAEKAAGPGLLTRFAPSVLAGTALASGAGFFKVPEQDTFGDPSEGIDRNPDGSPVTGQDLIDANPRRYLVEDLGSRRLNAEGEYEDVENYLEDLRERATDVRVATDNPLRVSIPENPGSPFARPFVQRAAEGGAIFPQDAMYSGGPIFPQDAMYSGGPIFPQNNMYSGSGNISPQNNMYSGSGNISPQNNMYSGSGNNPPEDAMYSGIGSGSTPAAPTVPSGQNLIDDDPGKYLIGDLGSSRLNAKGEYEKVEDYSQILKALRENAEKVGVPTNHPLSGNADPIVGIPQQPVLENNPGNPFARPPVQIAAEGGPIFPRRNGGIAPTEGVQGQDSVRAMLMPGEFVMTTDAVRGLGDGNLSNGIKSMYAVMRNLESRGREAA